MCLRSPAPWPRAGHAQAEKLPPQAQQGLGTRSTSRGLGFWLHVQREVNPLVPQSLSVDKPSGRAGCLPVTLLMEL